MLVEVAVECPARSWRQGSTVRAQESIHAFRKLDEDIELRPILERLAKRPPLDLAVAEETEKGLPEIVGGLTFALARAFTIIRPERKNPQTEQWERVTAAFDVLL